jgi:hypothetical protein
MNIRPAKDSANRCPRTRRELLAHLWGIGLYANVFKEGPVWAIQYDTVVAATHRRRINWDTYDQWAQMVRGVKDGFNPLC